MATPGLNLGAQTATDPQTQIKYTLAVALANIKRSAGWFDWIAALSVVNAVITIAQGSFHFILGLGITEFLTAVGNLGGSTARTASFIATLIIAGVFVMFGYFTKRGQKWALIVGLVFYAVDSLVVVLIQDWLMLAFHAYALYMLFRAFPAIKAYEQAKQEAVNQGVMV